MGGINFEKCNFIPRFFAVIGIGNDNFDKMDALDADQHALSIDGRTAVRDIVQVKKWDLLKFYSFAYLKCHSFS